MKEEPSTSVEISSRRHNLYGWGSFHPQWMQRIFNNGVWFLILVSSVNFLSGAVNNGLVKVSVSSIEKRFKLTSFDTGLIISMYDIAGCLCILPVSHLGGNRHKPRWIGVGAALQSVSYFIFTLPHFLAPSYTYTSEVDADLKHDLCVPSKDPLLDKKRECQPADNILVGDLMKMKYIFMLAQFLGGLGASPMSVLAITFMNENIETKIYPFYMGMYFLSSLIGPGFGFASGSYALHFFTEIFTKPTITADSSQWIGAWWLFFLISSFILLSLSIPILAFPPSLPQKEKITSKSDQDDKILVENNRKSKTVKRTDHRDLLAILKHRQFILLSCAAAFLAFIVSGFLSFGSKYVESQFNKSASDAATIFGSICVPAAAIGLLIGSAVMSKLKLSPRKVLQACFLISFVTIFAHVAILWYCDDYPFAGYNVPYPGQNDFQLESKPKCRDDCRCPSYLFEPVCGENQLTYQSACHAGCLQRSSINGSYIFFNCSCVLVDEQFGFASPERCYKQTHCPYQATVLIFIFIMIVGMFFCVIPGIGISLSFFPLKLRSLALGVQWVIIKTLGTIPGAVIFGALFDSSCLIWSKNCPQDKLSCLSYNNSKLSNNLFVLPIILKIISTICFLVVWLVFKQDENVIKVSENIRKIELVDNEVDELLVISENSTKTTKT